MFELKKIIKQRAKDLYLRSDGSWTARLQDAASFDLVEDAIRTAQLQNLVAVDLVYMFAETRTQFDCVFRLKD